MKVMIPQVLSRCLLLAVFAAASMGTAAAQAGKPATAHHQTSSLAPHPTKRRVFGDPIQGPILHHAPRKPKKPG